MEVITDDVVETVLTQQEDDLDFAEMRTSTSFPQPVLESRVNLMDLKYCTFQNRSYCSNCYEPLKSGRTRLHGKKFSDVLCSWSRKGSEPIDITVIEALDMIFELTKKSFLSKVILDEAEYSMCYKCCSILANLFDIFVQFADCARSPSYLKAILTHNRSLNKENQLSHELDNRGRLSDEADEFSNSCLDISLEEDSDLYVPPLADRVRRRVSRKTTSLELLKHEDTDKDEMKATTSDQDEKLLLNSNAKRDPRREKDRSLAYKCSECSELFSRPSRLHRHSSVHAVRKYVCNICNAGFKLSAFLSRHKRKQHTAVTDVRREKTSKGTIVVITTTANGTLQQRRRPFLCRECGLVFTSSARLSLHMQQHGNKQLNQSSQVKQEEGSEDVEDSTDPFFNDEPNLETSALEDDKDSLGNNPQRGARLFGRLIERTCPADRCTFKCRRSTHLLQHLKSKHNIAKAPIPVEGGHRCPVCQRVLKTKGKLDLHLAQRHRPLVLRKKIECDVCGKKFNDVFNYRDHKTSHSSVKPFICDKCGFATKRSYQLTRHIEMVHVGTRSHQCNECGVSFKKKQHLTDHITTHNSLEYRPFACSTEGCTKAYRSRRNLRQHMETAHAHSKVQCETCGRIFTRRDNLKVHVDTVHLGKPGRTQRQQVKVVDGIPVVKVARKRKEASSNAADNRSTRSEEKDSPVLRLGHGHQLVMLEDANNFHEVQQLQLITDGSLLPQGTQVPVQNLVAITNSFGEFFYAL